MFKKIMRAITGAYQNAMVINCGCNSKYVVMSDCHRGAGNKADNFSQNESIFNAALSYYYKNGFCYIEAGDGDELWENNSPEKIRAAHCDTFDLIERFSRSGRMIPLYGNHDRIKECLAHEAVILRNEDYSIFIVHGHQGDFINDLAWKLGRFLVRHVWRRLELIGINDPTRAAYNDSKQNIIESALTRWSSEHENIVIAGHTHRIKFPTPGTDRYFNDGCCIYNGYITAIEIQDSKISLVRWQVASNKHGLLKIKKRNIYDPVYLKEFF